MGCFSSATGELLLEDENVEERGDESEDVHLVHDDVNEIQISDDSNQQKNQQTK